MIKDTTLKILNGDVICNVNYYNFNKKDFDWVLLSDIDTKPKYRGKGLATKLMNELYHDITSKDPELGIYLFVRVNNTDAISLYKKLGYDTLKKYKLDDGEYYIMCKGKASKKSQFNGMKFS